MSIFDTVNPQAEQGNIDQVAYAPTAGFFEGWQMAYEAHVRTSSMSGLEYAFEKEDEEQARRWGETVDGSRVPRLRDVADFEKLAKHFVDGDALSAEEQAGLDEYDRAVDRANANGANIKKAGDVFKNVQQLAQRAEADLNRTPTTFGGALGEFTGGMIASLDPRTDPLNFATLPVGGAGKTVLARVGSQVGAQGVIETLNQVTGVQENRRLLGLEHGFAQGAMQVAFTAGGAGLLQGAGEGAVKLGRRWFGSPSKANQYGEAPDPVLEEPPAPPERVSAVTQDKRTLDQNLSDYQTEVLQRSPWRGHATSDLRTQADLSMVTRQLEDWAGPRPWEMDPDPAVSATAMARVLDGQSDQPLNVRVGEGQVDDIARQVDPNTFRVYDDLAERKAAIQGEIDRLQSEKTGLAQEAVHDISDEISKLKAKLSSASARNRKKHEKRIQALEAERQAKLDDIYAKDTTEMRMAREFMMDIDYQMRDLAPLVTRAYTKARKQWEPKAEELDGILGAIRDASTRRVEADKARDVPTVTENAEPSPVSRVLDNHPEVRENAGPRDDAADLVGRAIAEQARVIDQNVELYRASVDAFDAADETTLKLDGYEHEFDLDKDRISVPTDDGEGFQELTVREVLEQSKRDELELQSVMTCSTRKGS